ncbi:MAG TPA: discoidin domain-containing protein, partial [Polyangiaceae bacterium]|nr:discoidin domain-containing protein [Polyangiaceae bacterium]
LGNGDIEYSITFNAHQAYVEVFVKQNGVQNISGNIVSSEVHNANGTFSYRRVAPAAQYHAGDTISARFYSYKPNSPGVFTPGPQEQIWLPPYFYGTGIDCAPGCHPYIKALPNGSLEFSVTFSQLQSDVQAVIRRNGTQITSGSIISNGVVRNSNGSFTYRRVLAANQFALNDRVSVRFSGVVQGQPTVFVPGPTSGMWSSDFIFGAAPDPNCLVPPAPGTCIEDALPRSAAVASSQESSTLGAGKAIDGNFSTRWSSAFSNPQWIYVDLGQARHISRVDLTWETAASADYDIQVAADGTNGAGPWATIFTDPAGNGGFDAITNLNVTARYVRMFSRKRTTQYGNSLWEFEVFGDLNPGCTP